MKTSRLVLTLALCAAPALYALDYRIQIQRTAKAGQQYQVSCRFQETHRMSATFAGRVSPEQRTNYVAELEGLVKVLETDSSGQVTKASCTISNCFRVEDKIKRELLPLQSIVMASSDGKRPQLLVKGKPVDLETQKILAAAMQLKPVGPAPEDMMATDKPKKIGESWDVNPEPLIGLLKMLGLKTAESDIQGRATLENLVKVGDDDCLEIASKVYLKKLTPPLPPGVQVKQAFGAFRSAFKLPLDTTLAALEENTEMDFSSVAEVKSGANPTPFTTRTARSVKITVLRKYLR